MHVPEAFLRCLQHMDPLLSVRWGPHVQQWVIERKAILPENEIYFLRRRAERLTRAVNAGKAREADTETLHGVLEELRCAEDGKRVILFAAVLTDKIYNQLCLADIKSYGGYSRYCDHVEQQEAAKEADRERQLREWNIARNKEAAGVLRFLDDHCDTKLAHGCHDIAHMLGTKDYLPKSMPTHIYDANGRVASTL